VIAIKRLALVLLLAGCSHANRGAIAYTAEGTYVAREQAVDPREATITVARRYDFIVDRANRRVRREAQLLYPGGIRFHSAAVIDGERGFQWDVMQWRQGTDLGVVDPKEFDGLLRFANPQESLAITHVDDSPRIAASTFAPPPGYVAPPPAGQPAVRELAPRTFIADLPGGYHSMFVDAGDSVLVFEAPRGAEQLAALIERTLPGKRVSHVFVTHHHGDHTAGLATFIANGATIVAGRDADVAIRRQLNIESAAFELVTERRTIAGVDVIPVNSAHASTMLVFVVNGVVFQGDLFYVPERGNVPPQFMVVRELQHAIRGLRVDTIAGVHGRTAPATVLDAVRVLNERGE
jgi:glyoxylase-like metal-dependent hydrolase (beta-lactamase superfamily II)